MVVLFNFFRFVFKLILNDRRLFLFTALEYVFCGSKILLYRRTVESLFVSQL